MLSRIDGRRLLSRRSLLAAGLGSVALARCSHRNRRDTSIVSISRAKGYTPDLYEQVRRILSEHRIDVRGKRVLLKPNLVEFDPGAAINTHPLFVHAALEAFRALGAAEVRVAEGPGHRRSTLDLADAAGYFAIIPRFEDLFTDLNLADVSRISLLHSSSRLKSLYLPRITLACDLLVSMPKMKTHHWVGATLAMKNLFGVIPGGVYGWPKNVLHWSGINECIADLYFTFPRQFCLVDGIIAMEGNGPIQGKPKPVDLIVAGADPVAVDSTCCRIMGIDPSRLEYLTLAQSRSGTAKVSQIGESVRNVQSHFELPPDFGSIRLSEG